MKSNFTLFVACAMALGSLVCRAEDASVSWSMVVDQTTKIPMENVAYLMNADSQLVFTVVRTDNSVIEDVAEVTFEKSLSAVSDLEGASGNVEVLSTIVNNVISLTAATDVRAEIYDLSGVLLIANDIVSGTSKIDVSMLSDGIYVLRVGETSVKFIKK